VILIVPFSRSPVLYIQMNSKRENITKIPEIILKEINREASQEELNLLHDWLSQAQQNKELYEKLHDKENLGLIQEEYRKIDGHAAWERIVQKIDVPKQSPVQRFLRPALKYAAILILPFLIGAYFLYQNTEKVDSTATFSELEKQISELKESSLITAEGEVLALTASTKESVVVIDGAKIQHKDSTLLYNNDGKKNEEIKYNCLVTPKSKVFNLVLADGTKVWLNASSAIKYPVSFASDTRKVYLTGEAYFEVTHDATKPFIVSTDKMEVEVLGTSFDVMAYPTERTVETTLVHGKVHVKTENSSLILQPGMQAQLDKNTSILDQKQIDTELITSWRDGKYIFHYEDMEDVISKLSRWYNIEFSFINTTKKNLHFSGTLYKYNDIEETLHILELATNVKFNNTGETVEVN